MPRNTTRSKCANKDCGDLNNHPIGPNGYASVTCSSCSAEYTTRTFSIIRYDRFRELVETGDDDYDYKHSYSLRVSLPNNNQDIIEFRHSENLQLNRNDKVTISYDKDLNLTYLFNHDLGHSWYFSGGHYPGKLEVGCYVCLFLIFLLFIVGIVGLILDW